MQGDKTGERKEKQPKTKQKDTGRIQACKYLGETINNKGTLADHITEIEKKVKGATASIIA